MKKEMLDLKKEIRYYKFKYDLLQKNPCTKEENKLYHAMRKRGEALPDGVYQYQTEMGDEFNEFYTVYEQDLTPDEINEYLLFRKLDLVNTIKKCVVFFTVLAVISLIGSVFLLLASL